MSTYEVPDLRLEHDRAGLIAALAMQDRGLAIEWLVEERGIVLDVARAAVQTGAIGWIENDLGGVFAAVVRHFGTGQVKGVDLRFICPEKNHGHRFRTEGLRRGYGWTSSIRRLSHAQTIYLTEGVVSALAVESALLPGENAVVAIRGSMPAAHDISLDWVGGRRVVIVPDNDAPAPNGERAGQATAEVLCRRLLAMGAACEVVRVSDWGAPAEVGDIAALLAIRGAEAAWAALLNTVPAASGTRAVMTWEEEEAYRREWRRQVRMSEIRAEVRKEMRP